MITMSAVDEPLYTERTAAQLLGISPSYLRLLRSQKKIGCYHYDGPKWGRVLYSPRHISEFKQQAEQTPVAA
jgi:hypothetical protein